MRRRAAILAAVTAVALLAAACGGSSVTTSAGLPTLQDITAQALAYAKCMRSHGVNELPGSVREQPPDRLQHGRPRHNLAAVQGCHDGLPPAPAGRRSV